ncbi:MAG: carbohydrate-binding domain-containing protein [Clostridiales Family XIII bacterium]|jgi:hypothetical protein|nr:carbohydrate-binding domain-containing protein [Clostridiales Family XIII bacterium]
MKMRIIMPLIACALVAIVALATAACSQSSATVAEGMETSGAATVQEVSSKPAGSAKDVAGEGAEAEALANPETPAPEQADTPQKSGPATTSGVSPSAAAAEGGVVTITQGGEYNITGKLTQVVVAATSKDTVRLLLNGAEITNPKGAAIYASQCDKLVITLAEGTKNTVTDGGGGYEYVLQADEEPNAAIFSKDDLTINGKGSLIVNAGFNNGIGTKDDLVVESGTINITAANNGIKGNDSVTVSGGDLTIKAGNDGIQSSNATDAGKGFISITGGSFAITAARDGIQAETTLGVAGGTFNITAGGGSAKAPSAASAESYKGLKASGDIAISGGTFVIDSADDAVHSNANVTISGGTLTISTGDDGAHADGDLAVKGGTVNVTKSYEGLEGNNVTISGGTITVVATDDGINAAGGADNSGMGGRGFGGGDRFAAAGAHAINITGGVVTVYANSDVLDSNGAISVTGGTVAVFKMQGEGELLDADGTAAIPPALFGPSVAAGAKLSVLSGTTTLWSGTTANAATSFALIIPGLENGAGYTLRTDGGSTTLTATTAAPRMGGGMQQEGMRPGGGQMPGGGGGGGGRQRPA